MITASNRTRLIQKLAYEKSLKSYLKRQRDRSIEKYRWFGSLYGNSKTGQILTNSHMTDEAVYVLYFSHKQRLSYNYTHLVVLSAVVVRVVRLWCGLLVDVVWKGH